jgi:hypothetical protein
MPWRSSVVPNAKAPSLAKSFRLAMPTIFCGT